MRIDPIQPVLAAAAYELGERETGYRDVADFAARIEAFQMSDDAAVWGWGVFYRTERARADLLLKTGQRSLAAWGEGAGRIDAVILCGAELPPAVAAHASLCAKVLSGLRLRHAALLGVTLGRCNTMLQSIELACRLVRAGVHRAILVLACDRIEDEGRRFAKFAIFSDAAASCIVCADGRRGFAVRASGSASDPDAMRADGAVTGGLGRRVNDQIRRACGVGPDGCEKLFQGNLFRPIVKMAEQQAGFRPDQLYLENIARRSHCFSADPIVNLVDHQRTVRLAPGSHVMLASSVPGARTALLLQALG